MPNQHKLSLPAAIIINLNIMLGVGLFINTTELAHRAGALGALSYLIVGILLLPLILSIVKLLELYPEGGFYTFGKRAINPFVGFLSAWSYFTGKLASAMLAIHIFVHLMQPLFPALQSIHTFLLDIIFLAIIIGLNLLNLKIGSTIQGWLMVVKAFPIIFVVLTGIFIFQGNYFTTPHQFWAGIPSTIPLVLHAMIGFEAACSLSSKIKNAHINAPRAVLISYSIIIGIYCLYQSMFYGILGDSFAQLSNYNAAFPALFAQIIRSVKTQVFLNNFAHLAIATSALSGAFGIIYSNMWNLHILAQNNHVLFAPFIRKLNRHQAPFICVLIEGLVCILYLFITAADQISLQQITALACTLAYTISVYSLLVVYIKNKKNILLPLLGLINCAVLVVSCVYNLWFTSSTSLQTFGGILIFGIFMFLLTTRKQNTISATST